MGKKVWSPGQGPDVAPEQVPGAPGHVAGDGQDPRPLWAPSEGPVASDPGGPGGEPDGQTVPRQGPTALDER